MVIYPLTTGAALPGISKKGVPSGNSIVITEDITMQLYEHGDIMGI
jgi:hypothetical protein